MASPLDLALCLDLPSFRPGPCGTRHAKSEIESLRQRLANFFAHGTKELEAGLKFQFPTFENFSLPFMKVTILLQLRLLKNCK